MVGQTFTQAVDGDVCFEFAAPSDGDMACFLRDDDGKRIRLFGDANSSAVARPEFAEGEPLRHDDCWMARALRDGCDYEGLELQVERPDGTRRTTLSHARPVRNAHGAIDGGVNVMIDITEQKSAQAQLHESTVHLASPIFVIGSGFGLQAVREATLESGVRELKASGA